MCSGHGMLKCLRILFNAKNVENKARKEYVEMCYCLFTVSTTVLLKTDVCVTCYPAEREQLPRVLHEAMIVHMTSPLEADQKAFQPKTDVLATS